MERWGIVGYTFYNAFLLNQVDITTVIEDDVTILYKHVCAIKHVFSQRVKPNAPPFAQNYMYVCIYAFQNAYCFASCVFVTGPNR